MLAPSQGHVGNFELTVPRHLLTHLAPVQQRDLLEMP